MTQTYARKPIIPLLMGSEISLASIMPENYRLRLSVISDAIRRLRTWTVTRAYLSDVVVRQFMTIIESRILNRNRKWQISWHSSSNPLSNLFLRAQSILPS